MSEMEDIEKYKKKKIVNLNSELNEIKNAYLL